MIGVNTDLDLSPALRLLHLNRSVFNSLPNNMVFHSLFFLTADLVRVEPFLCTSKEIYLLLQIQVACY